ncbi:hypothetical protein [Streptomyces kronopolitis]|uniref:hypothetical protein n=1 Tax=Streptomyces kronopolitis TaxID=1612435 RepID=UPI0036BEEC46
MRKRSGRPSRFAAVPNETIDDAVNLDFMALALLVVLLRHRDGWELTLSEIGKKYGYGRDAMAHAMGALQVARYVVKIRIMSSVGNLWSTELYVYDTPARESEIHDLLTSVADDTSVRRVEVIEPTKIAGERASKRRGKLGGRPQRRKASGPAAPALRVRESLHSEVTRENSTKLQVGSECRVIRHPGDSALSKKTVLKEYEKKTNSVLPSVREAPGPAGTVSMGERTDRLSSGTAWVGEPQKGTAGHDALEAPGSPGVLLLLEVARRQPQLALAGRVLVDQGARVTSLLAAGHSPEMLLLSLAAKAPEAIRISPGAVISARITSIPARPTPASEMYTDPDEWGQRAEGWAQSMGSVALTPADRSLVEAISDDRVMPECKECGRPDLEPEHDQCPRCLGWPECTTCTSLTPRRANPSGNGQCTVCESADAP